MSFLGSSIVSDVGLRLLLGPLDTNIVVRTACCTVGTVLPVYTTFKAIERKDQNEQEKWLIYWAAYGSFSLIEVFTDKLLSWFPMYYHFKLAFLVWLQLPYTYGAKQLYVKHLRPLFLKYEDRLDQFLGSAYHEMVKLVSARQGEIQLVRSILNKIMGSVDHIFRGEAKPAQPQMPVSTATETRAIEGPAPESNDGASNHED
uniref:HVA22-like protein n=1 Tax=Tamarix hispida TaxID=189793 RepID=I7CU90_9CARY|nr:bZIP13 [Tamarix hispida]